MSKHRFNRKPLNLKGFGGIIGGKKIVPSENPTEKFITVRATNPDDHYIPSGLAEIVEMSTGKYRMFWDVDQIAAYIEEAPLKRSEMLYDYVRMPKAEYHRVLIIFPVKGVGGMQRQEIVIPLEAIEKTFSEIRREQVLTSPWAIVVFSTCPWQTQKEETFKLNHILINIHPRAKTTVNLIEERSPMRVLSGELTGEETSSG